MRGGPRIGRIPRQRRPSGSPSRGWHSTATWHDPRAAVESCCSRTAAAAAATAPQPTRRRRPSAGRLGTLLLDLLTADEEQVDLRSRELRFDIGLLARRLVGAVDWLAARFGGELRLGLFGASIGAAAALVAAAERPDQVAAVVSCGGRPDLVGPALEGVTAPTLLIVGGADPRSCRSTAKPPDGWPPTTAWRSCREPATCLRSPARSTRSPTWPPPGSSPTSARCLPTPRCGSRSSRAPPWTGSSEHAAAQYGENGKGYLKIQGSRPRMLV